MIDSFGKEGEIELVLEFLELMKRGHVKPDVITYTAVMNAFSMKKNTKKMTLKFGQEHTEEPHTLHVILNMVGKTTKFLSYFTT